MLLRMATIGLTAALIIPLLACAPAAEPPAPKGDVVIGGHTYRLPDEAFADGLVDHGPQEQLLLELPVPVKEGVEPATVQLLLTAPRTSDERERERQVLDHVRIAAHVRTADLGHIKSPFQAGGVRARDKPPELVQVKTYQDKSMNEADVFVRPPLSATTEFLACDRKINYIHYPQCDHQFVGPGMEIKASYDRNYSPYWSRIRIYVLDYLNIHKVR